MITDRQVGVKVQEKPWESVELRKQEEALVPEGWVRPEGVLRRVGIPLGWEFH